MLRQAKAVTTVGELVGQHFVQTYETNTVPLVVRNIPDWPLQKLKSVKGHLHFVYIGLADPSRGLEQLIDSTTDWAEDRKLFLFTTGKSDYIDSLKARVRSGPLTDRVTFLPPVPIGELQEVLGGMHVGIIPFPQHSKQQDFSEPNKFHQYLRAGLPVLTTPLRGLSKTIADNKLGWIAGGAEAEGFAEAVNAISSKQITDRRQFVAKFCRANTWEAEAKPFVDTVFGFSE